MAISVVIAESYTLVRQGLVQLMTTDGDIEVVGEATSGYEVVSMAQQTQPDAVLMNCDMDGMDGIAATRLIKRDVPNAQIVLYSLAGAGDDESILEAVQAGARGYITRDTDGTNLLKQLKHVAGGGIAISGEMAGRLLDNLAKGGLFRSNSHHESSDPLSAREREVLNLICHGYPNKQIASALMVSENTVRAHVRSLMQKLNVDNRTQLAIYAMRRGLGSQGPNGMQVA